MHRPIQGGVVGGGVPVGGNALAQPGRRGRRCVPVGGYGLAQPGAWSGGVYLLVAMDRPSQGGVVGGVACGISGSIGFVSVRSARLNGGWCAKGLMLQSEKLQLGPFKEINQKSIGSDL